MKHTLRCHGFGDAGQAARSGLAMGMHRVGGCGPKPRQPTRGCGQNRQRAGTWSRGPGFRGCDRVGACEDRVIRRSHVPLRGRIQARNAWNLLRPARDALSLGLPIQRVLAAPRFALSTILARNARAFHYVRDSTLSERRRTVNGGPVSCRDADGARRIVMNSRSWTWVQTSLLWHQRWFRINAF